MSFGELMESVAPPRRILRIDQMVPDWQPGESYQGMIKFTVLQMDTQGMTVDVTDVSLEGREKIEDREKPMHVVPSPS